MNKQRDNEKLVDQIHKLKWRIKKLQRQLDKIHNRETIFNKLEEDDDDYDDFEADRMAKDINKFKNATLFFKGKYVPKTLDFRIEYLQEEYYGSYLIEDIC